MCYIAMQLTAHDPGAGAEAAALCSAQLASRNGGAIDWVVLRPAGVIIGVLGGMQIILAGVSRYPALSWLFRTPDGEWHSN